MSTMMVRIKRGTKQQHLDTKQPLGTLSLVIDAPELRFQTAKGSQVIPVPPEIYEQLVGWHQDTDWFTRPERIQELLLSGWDEAQITQALGVTPEQVEQAERQLESDFVDAN
jgi:hypothetical protein